MRRGIIDKTSKEKDIGRLVILFKTMGQDTSTSSEGIILTNHRMWVTHLSGEHVIATLQVVLQQASFGHACRSCSPFG